MIKLVIDNLRPSRPHRFLFLVRQEHIRDYSLDRLLLEWAPGSEIIPMDRITEGAACTVLQAQRWVDSDNPLMIANCDQWVDTNINDYLQAFDDSNADGSIMTMRADDPKWSFVKFDEDQRVVEVVEKRVVSQEATVGIYNFRRGKDFIAAAMEMISLNQRVNGEFYVAPAYNLMLQGGSRIETFHVGEVDAGMYGLGTPEDLERFVQGPGSGIAMAPESAPS